MLPLFVFRTRWTQPVLRLLPAGILALLLAVSAADLRAQEHPFLAVYTVQEMPGGVLVDWTIHGGSTCDGQEVQRSLDGVHFEAIHRIEGICGSPEASTPYRFLDPAPPEFSLVHYRLKLGFDGFSSVKALHTRQLTTSQQRLFPNPAHESAVLVLNVSAGTRVQLDLRNEAGALVARWPALEGPSLELDLSGLPAGAYLYEAVAGPHAFRGRLLKR